MYPFDRFFNNQQMFRPLIFKNYHPGWLNWKPLEHLVDEFERTDGERVTLRAGDEARIRTLLQKVCPAPELKKIEDLIRQGGAKQALPVAFSVEYRNAYSVALKRAWEEYLRSDFQCAHEFFAVKFRLVPPNTPYKKRPKGQLVVTPDRVYLHKAKPK